MYLDDYSFMYVDHVLISMCIYWVWKNHAYYIHTYIHSIHIIYNLTCGPRLLREMEFMRMCEMDPCRKSGVKRR